MNTNIYGNSQICISAPRVPCLLQYRHDLTETCYIFFYLSLCLGLGLFMSYLYDLFFHYHFYYNNCIISLRQKNLFFGHVCQRFSLRVFLSFCLIFLPTSTWRYKSVACKKSVYLLTIIACGFLLPRRHLLLCI